MNVIVQRKSKSSDGIFGVLTLDWTPPNPFTCVTTESLEHQIPSGTYTLEFTYSPEFNMTMPLIDVPGRTAIRIHPANFPTQLLGCIAVGQDIDGDAIDNSRTTFNQLNKILNQQAGITITIKDIPMVQTT